MRVLIFSLSYFPWVGGDGVAMKEITDRMPKDIQFDMVTLQLEPGHPRFEKIGNINVYRIGGGLGYLSKILFVPQAALFALRRKYDVYWAMMTNMLFPISLLRLSLNRTPYILTLQDGDPFEYVFERARIRIFKPLLSYGFKHAKKIQTISHFLASWARKMGYTGVIEVIPNGVEVKRFGVPHSRPFNPEDVVLITTSRLVVKNGVGDVIEALSHLPPTIRFRILGVGPLESALRDQAQKLGVAGRVEFKGLVSQEELPAHLAEADIFVRPSLSEGQGVSFIEAMAASVPVVATPVGGIPDFLADGKTGVLCKPSHPKSVAQAIMRLVNDGELRERVRANALTLVRDKYDWDLIAEEMRRKVFNVV